MLKKCLLALAIAGLFTTAAKAAVTVNFTIVATPFATPDDDGANGTWKVFAQVTGDTSTTNGLSGIHVDVIGDSGITILDGDGTLGNDFTTLDMPTGTPTGVAGGSGFNQFISAGDHGVGITALQNVFKYTRNSGSTLFNILQNVGINAGTNSNGATWAQPVLVADGFYVGTSGNLTVSVPVLADITLLPVVQGTITATNPAPYGVVATVAGSNGIPVNVADVANGQTIAVGVPEPASLGVLALGGLALLARRRKAC